MIDAKLHDDLKELARLYAAATGHDPQSVLSIIADASTSPRSAFLYLDGLVRKGAVKDGSFERALSEFYWKYC
jgi:hypothetical protein